MTTITPPWLSERQAQDQRTMVVLEAVSLALNSPWNGTLVDHNDQAWIIRFPNMGTAAMFVSSLGMPDRCHWTSDHRRFDLPVIIGIRKG